MNDTAIDMLGNTIAVGSWVAYPGKRGSSSLNKIGRILSIEKTTQQAGWNNTTYNIYKCKLEVWNNSYNPNKPIGRWNQPLLNNGKPVMVGNVDNMIVVYPGETFLNNFAAGKALFDKESK